MWKKLFKTKLISKKAIIGLVIAAAFAYLHHTLYLSQWGEKIEFVYLDFLFKQRGPLSADPSIVIIGMDEASYQNLEVNLGQSWPRALHAQLLEKLKQAGVKRVIFDILFLGKSLPEVDQKLADALASLPTVIGADSGTIESEYGTTNEILYPDELFAKSASEVAMVGLPETHGVLRHFRIRSLQEGEGTLQPLAQAAVATEAGVTKVGPRDLINFYGPAQTISRYSYYQILEKSQPFPLEKLRGKTIFVGLQLRSELGPDQKDSYLTSFDSRGRTYGVEIHASIASNLLRGEWIRRGSLDTELAVLDWFVIVMFVIAFNFRPLRAVVTLFVLALLWFTSSCLAFNYNYFLPGFSASFIFAPFICLSTTLASYMFTRRNQLQLRRAFDLYLSPHMARQVAKDPKALRLGGEKVNATAFFTDIANFTGISETLDAERLTQMLNDYFTELVEVIFQRQGTLIKFIGDAVFALWGVPIQLKYQADAALQAAIQMRERLSNSKLLQKYPKLVTRIGIHIGPMVVGNLGSHKRFDFTAIGDSVNLASRVEGINKYLGTTLLITDAIEKELVGSYDLVCVGKVRVWGKSQAVTLYTIFEESPSAQEKEIWNKALQAFLLRDWSLASEQFKECLASTQFSKAANFYLEQVGQFQNFPPDQNWIGELILHSK